MLRNTFVHFAGIGPIIERRLWDSGITTWDQYSAAKMRQLQLFSETRDAVALAESRMALAKADAAYFAKKLPTSELYRVALTFPRDTIFVDIETTGLSLYYDYITMVGWEIDGRFDTHLRGSATEHMFDAFARAKAIVTFNGARFDLPFLRKEFPTLQVPECHIDLRFFVRRAGARGGQKEVEEQLGLSRSDVVKGIAGEAAPVLWHRYRWGDIKSLRLLVSYNHADVTGLKAMFDIAVGESLKGNGAPIGPTEIPKFSAKRTSPRFTRTPGGRGTLLAPFAGVAGPAVKLKDLRVPAGFCVVGIDLTGSAERPSGWCSLRDGVANTSRVGGDDELIAATLSTGAHLVSIDSPLSLPFGRIGVEDTDPTRDEYGITRQCERHLRQRGINVYPCLLPSMQRLTARGIQIATRFREMGIPVIESYPGAAQDILGIPRKRASLELLARGMSSFGVTGAFTTSAVSHDELDAITSAIVGAFFWGGRFEALGNEDEDYLIVPEVASGHCLWSGRQAVGLSGPIGAGKTTAGQLLQATGLQYGRYSQVIERMATDRGLRPTRESFQQIGREINEAGGGQRRLGRSLLGMLAGSPRVVIDGMRHPEDHAFLLESFGPAFQHITLEVSLETRRRRALQSGIAVADFDRSLVHPVESNVSRLVLLAHERIDNSGSVEDLKSALEVGVQRLNW